MPLPTPNKGESKDRFISRCMANNETKKEFPNRQQRYRVCESQEKKRSKAASSRYDTWLISSKPLR